MWKQVLLVTIIRGPYKYLLGRWQQLSRIVLYTPELPWTMLTKFYHWLRNTILVPKIHKAWEWNWQIAEVQPCVVFLKLSDVTLQRVHVQPDASVTTTSRLVWLPLLSWKGGVIRILHLQTASSMRVLFHLGKKERDREVGAFHCLKKPRMQFPKNCMRSERNVVVLSPWT